MSKIRQLTDSIQCHYCALSDLAECKPEYKMKMQMLPDSYCTKGSIVELDDMSRSLWVHTDLELSLDLRLPTGLVMRTVSNFQERPDWGYPLEADLREAVTCYMYEDLLVHHPQPKWG